MKSSIKNVQMFYTLACRIGARVASSAPLPANRVRVAASLLILVFLAGLVPGLHAQEQVVVPEVVNYQGRLESLQPNKSYTDGLYDMEFRVWDSATSTNSGLLWAEGYSVYVKDGNFNLVLGEGGSPLTKPLSPSFRALRDVFRTSSGSSDRFLGLTVKQDEDRNPTAGIECSPRQQMLSAPFAFQAQYAQYANSAGAGTFYATNGLAVSGSALTADVDAQFSKTLTVSGSATLRKDLSVSGSILLSGPTTLTETATLTKGMDVSGQTTLHGTVDLSDCSTTGGGIVPIGGIIMWSGTTAPLGWALCDGKAKTKDGKPVPDLSGRFVLAAGQGTNELNGTNLITRVVGNLGGSATHTLTIDEMPSHYHTNTVQNIGYIAAYDTSDTDEVVAAPGNKSGHGAHHFMTSTNGSNVAHSIMPPYYVLAFIIRLN